MASAKEIRTKYQKSVDQLLKRIDSRSTGFARTAKRQIRQFRRVLIDRLSAAVPDGDIPGSELLFLQRMKGIAEEEAARLDSLLKQTTNSSIDELASLGEDALKQPILGLGLGPEATLEVNQLAGISPELVIIAKEHSADLISLTEGGLSSDILKAINTQINLGVLGGQSAQATITKIAQSIGDTSPFFSRAEMIFRTEGLTISSLAQEVAAKNAQKILPMVKFWRWSRNGPTRASTHGRIDGQKRTIGRKFKIPRRGKAGHDFALFPRDPNLPPEQRINCGCTMRVEPDFTALDKLLKG